MDQQFRELLLQTQGIRRQTRRGAGVGEIRQLSSMAGLDFLFAKMASCEFTCPSASSPQEQVDVREINCKQLPLAAKALAHSSSTRAQGAVHLGGVCVHLPTRHQKVAAPWRERSIVATAM